MPDFSVSYSFTLESLEIFCIFFFNLIVRFSSLSANGRIEIQIGIENGMCSSGKSGRHPICSPTNVMDIFTRMSLSKFCTYSLFFMMLLFGFIFRPTVFFFFFSFFYTIDCFPSVLSMYLFVQSYNSGKFVLRLS